MTRFFHRSWLVNIWIAPIIALLALISVACGTSAGTEPSASATPLATIPAFGPSPTALRYVLLDRFDLFFCDPHQYPVSREGEEERQALEQFPSIQADAEEFLAISSQIGLDDGSEFTTAEKLLVFREHKKLQAVTFDPIAGGYRFQMRIQEGNEGFAIEGTVSSEGEVALQKKESSFNTCPICLAGGTRVATPQGEVAVEDLRPGMAVWTQDAAGTRVETVVASVVSTPVSLGHQVLAVRLDDGRELVASAGHPTADGRVLAELRPGDAMDGGRVASMTWMRYQEAATYDLLPLGPTGVYWAGGILVGSTLFQTKSE
ncbi:MAG: Hint domain-containing protein [Chloroflexi bacterium]|nr:Hint domain-containing protein [Chloroflexota bacterium]